MFGAYRSNELGDWSEVVHVMFGACPSKEFGNCCEVVYVMFGAGRQCFLTSAIFSFDAGHAMQPVVAPECSCA
jgi:hypothetical protein